MSNPNAHLRRRFLDGTLSQGFEENVEESESSFSSDGSNEPHSDQSASSNFQSGMTSFPAISMTQPQQDQGEGQASTVASRMFRLPEISEQEMNRVSVRNLNYGIPNNYHALSPFDSSSRLPYSPSPISRTSGGGSSFTRQSQHQLTMPDPPTSFGPQDYRFQNLMGQGIGSNSFHPIELQNMPIQKRMGLNMGLSLPPQSEGTPTISNGMGPTISNGMMQMTWQDNSPALPNLHPHNLLSQGQSQAQSYGFPCDTRHFRNTVYDPMYEAMGLPIDPHLRMFIARRDNGDGWH